MLRTVAHESNGGDGDLVARRCRLPAGRTHFVFVREITPTLFSRKVRMKLLDHRRTSTETTIINSNLNYAHCTDSFMYNDVSPQGLSTKAQESPLPRESLVTVERGPLETWSFRDLRTQHTLEI